MRQVTWLIGLKEKEESFKYLIFDFVLEPV